MAKFDFNTLNELEKRIGTLEKQSDVLIANKHKLSELEHECYLRALFAVKNTIKAMIYE